jgi:hypothetical protein
MTDNSEAFRIFLSKNVFSLLSGFTFLDWVKLLVTEHFSISPRYVPRAIFITLNSIANSVAARLEQTKYADQLANVKVRPPIFIVGHWRSGTSHLHNLLSIDPQFAYPNFVQATHPHTFLTSESRINRSRFVQLLSPRTRMIDNMSASLGSPMEDEVALCILTRMSPILSIVFPRHRDSYKKYLTFEGLKTSDLDEWKQSFVFFLKKLTLKYDRPLVLKSPHHTCRIRHILDTFPDARFIHIHRNPYETFKSYKRSIAIAAKLFRLQRAELDDEALNEEIITQYNVMYNHFFNDRRLIPENQFIELAFEDLEANAIGSLKMIYEKLKFGGFDMAMPLLQSYLDSIRGYRKSSLTELEPTLVKTISRTWSRSFREWGYEMV